MEERYICVYAASSEPADAAVREAAEALGAALAMRGYSLCYGAGRLGLMGAVADAVRANGGRVLGVIPKALDQPGITYEACDELIVTDTMRERKQIMEERSAAFVALPGGFGTLEELMEILTLKQLRYHNKPIAVLNTGGFYDALEAQFDLFVRQGVAKASARSLYYLAQTPAQVVDYIAGYKPAEIEDKLPYKIGNP